MNVPASTASTAATSASRIHARSLAAAFVPAGIVFLLGLVATVAWRLTADEGWWLPLYAGGGIAGYLAWKRTHWSDGWTRFLSFGALVLLACTINRVLYLFDFAFGDGGYLDWPFYAEHPEAAIIKSEVITILGTLVTVIAWWLTGGSRHSPGLLLNLRGGDLVRLMAITYATSLLALAVTALVPQLYAVSGQLLPTMLVLGSSTAFFLPILLARSRAMRLLIVILMGLPFLFVALGTGMKENIILALAPTAYLLWSYPLRRGGRLALGLVALLAVALITSYIGYFRGEVWHADRAIDQTEALQEYVDGVGEVGLAATVTEGSAGFLARNNVAPSRGWAVAIADTEGYSPELVFSPLLYVFVPRMLWPEKPPIRQGWEYSGLVFGADYISWSDSSLSAGLYPALYLGGGWIAVVLAALAIGFSMSFFTYLAYRLGGQVLVGLFTLSMLPFALRLDEAWTVGAFSAPLINFVYIAAIFFGARVLASLLGPARGAGP